MPVSASTETTPDGGVGEAWRSCLHPRRVPGAGRQGGAGPAGAADLGTWGLNEPTDPASRQWLRPDQLIPVLRAALKETRAEVAGLRGRAKA
jgi:hypothetical protein